MKRLARVVFFVSLVGCATPSQRFNERADQLQFSSEIIRATQFQHQIFSSRKLMEGKILHVYLDGDGTPWESNRWIADDPTARNPLILGLMKQDNQPSILLGRPCYYGLNHSDECANKYWTTHRYSKDVAQSMAQALNIWLANHHFEEVILIGYSGGGSLSLLIANEIQNIKKVVTLAANLNVSRWREFHGYPGLNDSLNPSDVDDLNTEIMQYHFAGVDDQVVPAFIIKDFAESQQNALYFELSGNDHACCWEKEWIRILEIIRE